MGINWVQTHMECSVGPVVTISFDILIETYWWKGWWGLVGISRFQFKIETFVYTL